jgi:tRNA (adenine22-N1)-methyltransferase
MINLSKRLLNIAGRVQDGARLADIGSDHALLPVFLVQQSKVRFAVAGEIHDGPLEAAARQVGEHHLAHAISVRKGDGLDVISPGEVDCITIAGMGGSLIVHILERGKDKLDGVARLVLQPNVGEDRVRFWLGENGWLLTAEDLIEEGGKFYEILTAERHPAARRLNEELYAERAIGCGLTADRGLLLLLGPHLIREPSAVWFRKWREECVKMDRMIREMARSTSDAAARKRQQLQMRYDQLLEVLECLQKAKP